MAFIHSGITETVLSFKPEIPLPTPLDITEDRGTYADPEKRRLLSKAAQVIPLTPYVGTELVGIQLDQLDVEQKDDLALLAAERGVVFLRDQKLDSDGQYEFIKHFGPVNQEPNQSDPRHVTIVGRDTDIRSYEGTNSGQFHSDLSFQPNPSSYTLLRMVRTPETGGDTIFVSQYALFSQLSKPYQKLLEGLHATHTSEHVFVNAINRGRSMKTLPGRWEHPLVRTHPVTKLKSLYYSPVYTTHIPELKAQESAHTLNFLREHLHEADDLSVRWHWTAGSVAFWDNRIVTHRPIPGGYEKSTREGKRCSVYGERPFYDPNSRTLEM
ncbi:hypothetical protein N7537_011813 [Penicillium hordei]|uniref:TauD/TfdA-like domain-containing protein n=1 Tax=Penicillium hordei TaxID=40994 RepID=A0AAD6DN27_9EURO|nr:uncharacterized protein N7537_011813 [Penicillium hordei]KAJ5589135.1 hypothetical protein N7537_011813 [Penicillium hordei]